MGQTWVIVILNEYKNIGGLSVKPYTSTAASVLWKMHTHTILSGNLFSNLDAD